MAKVLVTGGCGFIGSNFIHYLLETDPTAQVINLDALTYAGNLANLEAVASNQRYAFVHGSVTDRELVRGILREGVHSVLHFAAESHVDRSIQDSGPFVRTNVIGTQILLRSEADAAAQGFSRYDMMATLTGRPFYARHGYRAGNEFSYTLPGGLGFPLVHMEKSRG